jgi:hypothetical protein
MQHNQVMKHELYISFQVPSSVTLNILSNGILIPLLLVLWVPFPALILMPNQLLRADSHEPETNGKYKLLHGLLIITCHR